ncbi:MAG: biotin/lipoyl-binding protein [Candidatus Nanopelagicales bacterium]|nr:biotin/lipoyl-binding protein [Candidatus Nanopelagicales bacterium]
MRILVANRGEIACRVFRTASRLGHGTVAVFTEADRGALHTRSADLAVTIESYLDAGEILRAAARAGADAIHPGYGFLSENPDFAQAVTDAGLTWIGPTPDSIRAMALKVEAKALAEQAGVPMLTSGTEKFPVLVKASAGGGGKGMRRVDDPADLEEAIAAAKREAASAFGDDTVFVERYLEHARHVEVQVFGDTHGNVVHLFERECSIQRRHQKVVEESPSPGVTPELREQMTSAAVSLAAEIGYVGAGTVEFMVAGDEFFFLEMNTRLQVEHPVTEGITGLDLVEWQIRVAQREPLPLTQEQIQASGHAIEVRLYAEDPANGYLPNTGTLRAFDLGPAEGIRVDTGFVTGDVVTANYDPMLAKVIATAASRDQAADRLADYLRRAGVEGVVTNKDSLAAVLDEVDFRAGATPTDYLDNHPAVLDPAVDVVRHALAVLGSRDRDTPVAPAGWRNVRAVPEWLDLQIAKKKVTLRWTRTREGLAVETVDGDPLLGEAHDVGLVRLTDSSVEIDGMLTPSAVVGDEFGTVTVNGHTVAFEVLPRFDESAHHGEAGGPTTPVPGTVTDVRVAVGDEVTAGQILVVLEAMKMEHTITADSDGVVTAVHVRSGQSVDAHQVVVTVE